jgi:acetyl esterase/lipase
MRNAVILAAVLSLSALGSAQDPPLRILRDIPYLEHAGYAANKDKLDLYLPAQKSGVPVVVYYYGGALQQGDKSEEQATGRRFASAGFATAVVNYRLSPDVSHPAHMQDAAASFAWVKKHIAEYGGAADQIFIVGHSAGAYLAALLAADERYLAAQHLTPRDIRGVVPISAFYWVEREGVAPDRPKTVWGTDRQTWIDASPAHHLRAGLPPMLIMYADGDEPWRRQQNVDMAAAVKAAGNPRVDLVEIPNRTHMSIWQKLGEDGDPTAERAIAFIRATAAQPPSRD